ncbi:chorismate-binding protein [Algibacter sp. L4_22]|uniref:chorismate-binding protein n=1 Tax=Algibacter sp. L4_22 TaxID=2942477 RepID=UPI00201B4E6B|nr:chorismate-binding protein [Algibacter sp. L4_22]MCL5128408.1 chorismate-binding protein [Algibacter sp. L4_22]
MTFNEFFNRIESQYNVELPFVVYRKPNENSINALLQKTDDLIFTQDFTEKGFVFSPFDNTEKSVLMPLEFSEKFKTAHTVLSDIVTSNNEPKTQNNSEKEIHINLVKSGVEAIKNNEFKKVVLSRSETVLLSDNYPLSIFKKLLEHYASAFVYCWYHPKVGLWLGATPETLVKIEGQRFSIMALAGTQNYNGSLDVEWQDKELQEQQYVTDFILNNIKSTIDNIKISAVETVKAGNLLHLKTKIWGVLRPNAISLKDLLYSLHPTPAVCGLPKLDAKQFILKNESYNREFYTGFLGELNLDVILAPRSGKRNIENRAYATTKKSTQLYVNLRCMQLKENNAIIYVGGGITESSCPESEWEETVSKSLVIKKVL